VTATTVPAQKIDSSSLQREAAPQRGDSSFGTYLEDAQNDLERKSSLSPIMDRIGSLLEIVPLSFKFDFKASRIEENFNQQTQPEQKTVQRDEGFKESPNQPAAESTRKNEVVISDLQAIKQALIQNIPLPLYAPTMPLSSLSTSPTSLSKVDLQSVIDQIVEQAKLIKSNSKVQLLLGINQEELGTLLVELTSRQGLVSIQICAPEQIKKELESCMEELKRALKDSHIRLEGIEITEVKEEQYV